MFRSFIFCIILITFSLPLRAQKSLVPIDSLDWMAGYWKHMTEGSETEEQWMGPLNNLMVGMSRNTDTGFGASFEFLRIVQNKKGAVQYIAMPSGKKETVFTLTHYKNREVWFENPEHDFPRKIVYRLNSPGELTVILDGIEDGQPYRYEYIMNKENGGN
jgi:hypothetical protein